LVYRRISKPAIEEEKMKQLHVLMFPWLAYGHILPYLELSHRLANHGVKISFLSTPRNISKIRPLILEGTGLIDLVELSLPSVEGLPAGAESTADVPNEMEGVLKTAVDGLEQPFEDLLKILSPDYVIFDFSQYWAATVAAKFGIPAILLLIFPAVFTAYAMAPCRDKEEETTVEELIVAPPDFPSSEIVWQPFEARYIIGAFNSSNGQMSVAARCFKSIKGCSFIAIRSCLEIEGKFIEYLARVNGKAVVPVGTLSPDLPQHGRDNLSAEDSYCLRWLDERPDSSVVYVSFGSECFLSEEQIHALALGLEATGAPFLWVLRSPRFSNGTASGSALLPEGFESRTRERGVVYSGWAPQLHILAHPSVGVFMSHAGWSSVIEAVKFGVKLVLLPMNVDQGINARLIANELKAGLEIEREGDGSFSKDDIRTAVLKVLDEDCEEGRNVKSRIEELGRSVFGNSKCEEKCVRGFIKCLDLYTPPDQSV
ncbi:hypothetical protein KI387_017809, partial [Taxus chinensis]